MYLPFTQIRTLWPQPATVLADRKRCSLTPLAAHYTFAIVSRFESKSNILRLTKKGRVVVQFPYKKRPSKADGPFL